MNRELFKITIDGIKGRKKISILFVIIFTVSFAFGIITLSITSSMNRTNEQYRMNTYGAWSSAVKFSSGDPVKTLDNGKSIQPEWAENYGSITICAKLQTDSGDDALLPYGFAQTSGELDAALEKMQAVFADMLELAQVEKTMQLLAQDIEKTRRRVNALEYVMIPETEQNIRYITMKLDENERGNTTRLMKVKEMVLQDAHHYQP